MRSSNDSNSSFSKIERVLQSQRLCRVWKWSLQNSMILFVVEKHKLFMNSNFSQFHWFEIFSLKMFCKFSFLRDEILSFSKCTNFDTIRFFCWFDLELFLFLKIILIFLKSSFQISSLVISQNISFDLNFSSCRLSLCHSHKKKESVNHW